MKTIKMAAFILAALSAIKVDAQITTSKSISHQFDNMHVVIIKLSGDIVINATDYTSAICNYQVITSGKVWGFSNISARPPYSPEIKIGHDTMYITGEAASIWQIGISSYTEAITNVLYLPKDTRVYVDADDNLSINGSFLALHADCDNATTAVFQKKDVNNIHCVSKGDDSIIINGKEETTSYEYKGDGFSNVFISSDQAMITLK